MKKCTLCKETKPLDDFYRNRSRYDGWENHCKACDNRKKEQVRKQTNYYKSPKALVRMAVSSAIASGRLIKKPCEACGSTKTQAHHCDYNKPLDVMWLCNGHHLEWHRNNVAIAPTNTV